MMMASEKNPYKKKVLLLIHVLPIVMRQKCFCLKGGTAINLFIRDFPRISVDIDLTYVPFKDRVSALQEIQDSLLKIKQDLENELHNIRVFEKRSHDGQLLKIFVRQNDTQITVEPNLVLRGTLYSPQMSDLSAAAEHELQASVLNIPVLHKSELYAGKVCAALDRQHPRDLFDILLYYENEDFSKEMLLATTVYLACAPRPTYELLKPNRLDIKNVFENEFEGMANRGVTLNQLHQIQERLLSDLISHLSDHQRQFLISLSYGEPLFDVLPFKNLSEFPALKWKVLNIKKMDSNKRNQQAKKLENLLA